MGTVRVRRILLSFALLLVARSSPAAQPVYLDLFINDVRVAGGSTTVSLGREGHIECLSFMQETSAHRDPASGMLTGMRSHQPIVITKPIDRSSPLLARALVENARVRGVFRFFTAGPSGTDREIYRIAFNNGHVDAVRSLVDDVLAPGAAVRPAVERVTFSYSDIEWTWLEAGITYRDAGPGEASGPSTPGQGQPGGSPPSGQRLQLPGLKLIRPAPTQ